MGSPRYPEVVITGLGAVSAYGWGTDPLWAGLRSGSTAIGTFDLFDHAEHRTHVAGQVPPRDRSTPPRSTISRTTTSRSDEFALAAVEEALESAGGIDPRSTDAGVFFGSSTGGMFEAESFFRAWVEDDRRRLRRATWQLSVQQNNAPGDAVARRFGVSGPVETISTACAASSMAIGNAFHAVRSGEVEVAIAGGADGLCQLTYAGFNSLRAVDASPCRPFRAQRAGLSLGEGSGVLVLERADRARERGAPVRARLVGVGSSCDAHHMTAPIKDGSGAARAIEEALSIADRRPDAVDFVNAHGTGTPHNDAAEWNALAAVFGDRASSLPTTSTKGGVGHLLGAAGAIEAVATVLCIERGEVHPTPGDGDLDPAIGVDLVRDRPRGLRHESCAISVNLAFGGANSALVIAAGAGS